MKNETFGEVIREARKLKGISLREMASTIGISHPYLSQLETGRNNNPSIEIILSLSRELDLSFSYLVHLSDVDIGTDLDISDNIMKVLKLLKPSDYENWNTFEEFKQVFSEKNYLPILNNTDEIEASEELIHNFYEIVQKFKKIEQNTVNSAVIQQALAMDETTSTEKEAEKRLKRWQGIDNYNRDIQTAIYLNPNNEGKYYFFKEGIEIPEETQEKLRLIIKTILD
ncbi:helix-turn-helix domain-containing protein [Lysinibacillus sp. NPDC097214]|uniref:helix-turn-helix domain-containing protein n=1 Tax=Lysinibacillus sp. NPDC097214 TaxID=3390584 RepID=UPI003D029FB1